jgi:hypothetical protein
MPTDAVGAAFAKLTANARARTPFENQSSARNFLMILWLVLVLLLSVGVLTFTLLSSQ